MKKEIELFNNQLLFTTEPTSSKKIFIFGESPGKFHETLRIYESLRKKRVGMVYHYLLPRGQQILSSIAAIQYAEERLMEDDVCNFDLPMLTVTSGIKVAGYAPKEGYLSATVERLNGLIIAAAEDAIDGSAIICPQINLDDGTISEALPWATIIHSKY